MTISMEEAAKRILICGADDVQYIWPKYNVGMVFITKPYLTHVDYRGLPTHECYIPPSHCKQQKPDKKRNEEDVKTAIEFLENNPDKDLLVHCNAGIGVSPSFVFMLLVKLQGDEPNFDQALQALNKMTLYVILDVLNYQPLLPIELEDAKRLKFDYTLASKIYDRYKTKGTFQEAFDEAKENNFISDTIRPEEAIIACRRFGFHVEQGPKKPDYSGIKNAQRIEFLKPFERNF